MRRASALLGVIGTAVIAAFFQQAEHPALSSEPTQAKAPAGELRRRATFGAELAPLTKEVRDRQKLDGDSGVMVERVFPGTSAADADFKAGDVILAIGGADLAGVPLFLDKVANTRAGDVVTLDVVRDGVKAEKRVTLMEMPREKGEGYDVIYDAVTSHGARFADDHHPPTN